MENEASQTESNAFSYDILDQEAHKISELLLAVQQRCAQGGPEVAEELFGWAEEYSGNGRRAEAEFLYLYAVNLWERQFGVTYPIHFKSLRHYALTLRERCVATTAQQAPILTAVPEQISYPVIESNAA